FFFFRFLNTQTLTCFSVASVQRNILFNVNLKTFCIFLHSFHIISDLTFQAYICNKAKSTFRIDPWHIPGIRIPVRISVFHVEQYYKFISVFDHITHLFILLFLVLFLYLMIIPKNKFALIFQGKSGRKSVAQLIHNLCQQFLIIYFCASFISFQFLYMTIFQFYKNRKDRCRCCARRIKIPIANRRLYSGFASIWMDSNTENNLPSTYAVS